MATTRTKVESLRVLGPKLKRKILPKSKNGVHRKHASLGCYQYQKHELIARASARNMSVSYYLNYLLWKDWL